ncbi:hypothetical protein [Actinoplanes sp. NPDC089786]|uniref:hypothetical protein n=1 Tax=Actinoplanes sp. NPDC089786 TaxID=3155185 RepID=UPI003438F7EF
MYNALREAGQEPAQIPRTERLLSTAILGFAASEAAGRFSHHRATVRDADFACLLNWLRHIVDHASDRGCPAETDAAVADGAESEPRRQREALHDNH